MPSKVVVRCLISSLGGFLLVGCASVGLEPCYESSDRPTPTGSYRDQITEIDKAAVEENAAKETYRLTGGILCYPGHGVQVKIGPTLKFGDTWTASGGVFVGHHQDPNVNP